MVEHVRAAREVPVEQYLDELRDEFPVVGMEPMHVLRPHVLGQRLLRPRELEVQRRVQLVLSNSHELRDFVGLAVFPVRSRWPPRCRT